LEARQGARVVNEFCLDVLGPPLLFTNKQMKRGPVITLFLVLEFGL